MSDTPLYSALHERSESGKLRFHMPGHKGRHALSRELAGAMSLDFTELYGTGNLYDGTPPISDAEDCAARAWRVDGAYFLTGGATQGIHAAVRLCNGGFLIDRGCHRSVYNALALMGEQPLYLRPKRMREFDIQCAVSADEVDAALTESPETRTVFITSPTYYGVVSDISAIAAVCRRHGARLAVDEAHGAHFPFHEGMNCAVALGADIGVCSMHKTLPALGQAALLTVNKGFLPEQVRRATAMFGSSSPSYVVMASMDMARAEMEKSTEKCNRLAQEASELKKGINERNVFKTLIGGDPLRLCVNTMYGGVSGYEAARILEQELGIVPEMADMRNVLFIITIADEELSGLDNAIRALESYSRSEYSSPAFFPEKPPEVATTLRDALMAEQSFIPFKDALGRVAAQNICPYPPGIPVIAAGEVIDGVHAEYLYKSGFFPSDVVSVLSKT